MRRPVGILLLVFFMANVAFVGAAHTVLNLTQPYDGVLVSPPAGSLALAYAATALAATVGFWRMQRWAVNAFLAWVAVLAGLMIHMLMGPWRGMWLEMSTFACITAALAALVVRYARRRLIHASEGR